EQNRVSHYRRKGRNAGGAGNGKQLVGREKPSETERWKPPPCGLVQRHSSVTGRGAAPKCLDKPSSCPVRCSPSFALTIHHLLGIPVTWHLRVEPHAAPKERPAKLPGSSAHQGTRAGPGATASTTTPCRRRPPARPL